MKSTEFGTAISCINDSPSSQTLQVPHLHPQSLSALILSNPPPSRITRTTPRFPTPEPTIPFLRRSGPAQPRRQFLSVSFRTAALLCTSFLLFFILAVSAASMTWNRYKDSKREWPKTQCTLRAEDPTNVGTCPRGFPPYRADVFVTDVQFVSDTVYEFELARDDDGFVRASQGAVSCLYDSEEEANAFAERFENRGGDTLDCYTNGIRVRLSPGAEERGLQGSRLLRAIFSTCATIFAALAVLYSIYHLCTVATRPRQTRHRQDYISPVSPVAGASNVYRTPLSVNDTNMLVQSFEQGHDGGTCPICLEEFEGDSRKTRTLPCKHAYHEECALQWFRKGHASCPYCNYDLGEHVQKLRQTHDSTVDPRLNSRSSVSSEPHDASAWTPRRNRSVRFGQTDNV